MRGASFLCSLLWRQSHNSWVEAGPGEKCEKVTLKPENEGEKCEKVTLKPENEALEQP